MPGRGSSAGSGGELATSIAFVGRAALWVIFLFGLTRVPWVQQHLLLPFAAIQGRIGCGLFGTPVNSVFVGLSCTGTDPMALVVGAILAFPVAWRRRLWACLAGVALILGLNTLRIGTLSLLVDRRELFELLHYYLWPAFLIVVAAAYVFVWMARTTLSGPESATTEPARALLLGDRASVWRFAAWLVILVGLFYLASGWIFRSVAVLEVARWAAHSAGAVMSAFGVTARVNGNVLETANGSFLVAQSCVATPLLPVYLAAVLSLSLPATRKGLAFLAALPLFVLLGTARLLVLALPLALVGSHNVAIHAFYQVLTAVLIVVLVGRGVSPRALAAGAGAALVVGLLTQSLIGASARLGEAFHFGHGYVDSQGALALMPAFQLGFLVALWLALGARLGPRRFAAGAGLLLLAQMAILVLLGELAVHAASEAPVTVIRALSLALPIVVLWLLARRRKHGRSAAGAGCAVVQ